MFDRPGCGMAYVDTSRNGRRRFRTTRCANRVYVADHRSRHP
ncbi:CGNR zinc finger domain-containing protein [Streptosporangium lutulentum]|uniref:RNA-binding Zn ribbon-like protein n=1 Tax=Streptosporangium lutulentum TaxID=1461250 RepID=A0ABT9Q5Z7_9ACTN|nr:CGNR zinc finger domain-containing protein [Streptosporangium lutulentum]MDP9841773.1 putative RNA-binding Zn ribbon-like protein [Streptosporangium lutulentum]